MKTLTSNFKEIEDTIIFENQELENELSNLLDRAKNYSDENTNNENISDEEFEAEYKRLLTEGFELTKEVSKSEFSKERGCVVNYGVVTLNIF
jgi:hypothetical protein